MNERLGEKEELRMFGFRKKKAVTICGIDELKAAAEYLRKGPKVECDPYPRYTGDVFTVLNSLGTDVKYGDKYELIKDKDISQMSIDDLRVMYTFILRSERFCDGSIMGYIEDGTILKLLEREIAALEK